MTLTVSAADGDWTNTNVSVSATGSDPAPGQLDRVDVPLDGTLMASSFTVSTEGAYTVTAQAFDKAGNASVVQTRTFTVNKTAPTVEIFAGPAADSWQRATVSFSARIDDTFKSVGTGSLPAVTTTLSATAAGTGTLTVMPMPLVTAADGTVELTVSAPTASTNDGYLTVTFHGQDRAGNTASAQRRIPD